MIPDTREGGSFSARLKTSTIRTIAEGTRALLSGLDHCPILSIGRTGPQQYVLTISATTGKAWSPLACVQDTIREQRRKPGASSYTLTPGASSNRPCLVANLEAAQAYWVARNEIPPGLEGATGVWDIANSGGAWTTFTG